MRTVRVAVLIAFAATGLAACSGSAPSKGHPAPVAAPGSAPNTVTRAMYGRVKPNLDAAAISKYLDTKIEVDPAAYGLYYRVPERLVAVMLKPTASKAQVDALRARLEATGWFSKILIGGAAKVPDAIFSSTTTA